MAKVTPLQLARRDAIWKQIKEILAMFESLGQAYERFGEKAGVSREDVQFDGFDARDEQEAEYLRAGQDMTRGNREPVVFDSHMPRLAGYLAMLERWRSCRDANNLTLEDLKRIVRGS